MSEPQSAPAGDDPHSATAIARGRVSHSWRFGQDRRLEMVRGFTDLDGAAILDVGCGTAQILRYLPEGIEYLGFDQNARYLECARNRFTARRARFLREARAAALATGTRVEIDFRQVRQRWGQRLRAILHRTARLKSQRVESTGKALTKDEKHYRDYFDYAEHIQRVPDRKSTRLNSSHRT